VTTSQRASRLFAIAGASSSALLLLPMVLGRTQTFSLELAAILFAGALAGWLAGALFTRHPSRWGATWRGAVISLLTLAATNLLYWCLLYYWYLTSVGESVRLKEAATIAVIGTVLFSWYAVLFGVIAGWLVIWRTTAARLATRTGT
jgi:hypothetical protein